MLERGRDGSEVVAGERKVGEVCVSCKILCRNFAQVVETEMELLKKKRFTVQRRVGMKA